MTSVDIRRSVGVLCANDEFKSCLETLQWRATRARHAALIPPTDDCVRWSAVTVSGAPRCFDGLCAESRKLVPLVALMVRSWRLLARRRQTAKGRFLDYDVPQWFQLHVRALFLASGTVGVAASLADKHGVFDCFNQLMCFADMLRVFGTKPVDQVLRRTEWTARLVDSEHACMHVSPRFSVITACFEKLHALPTARGAGLGAWCWCRGIASKNKPMASET